MTPKPAPPAAPRHWRDLTAANAEVRVAVQAFFNAALNNVPMTVRQVALVRVYCSNWIFAACHDDRVQFDGAAIRALARLRRDADGLTNEQAIRAWLARAHVQGFEPL